MKVDIHREEWQARSRLRARGGGLEQMVARLRPGAGSRLARRRRLERKAYERSSTRTRAPRAVCVFPPLLTGLVQHEHPVFARLCRRGDTGDRVGGHRVGRQLAWGGDEGPVGRHAARDCLGELGAIYGHPHSDARSAGPGSFRHRARTRQAIKCGTAPRASPPQTWPRATRRRPTAPVSRLAGAGGRRSFGSG